MGSFVKLVRCPYHYDTNPSFAIYQSNYDYTYYCFGCKRWGRLPSLDALPPMLPMPIPMVSQNKDLCNVQTYKQFLRTRRIKPQLAEDYGLVPTESRIMIPLYDTLGRKHGTQIRFLHKKRYLLPKGCKQLYSLYAQSSDVLIVESVFDGLSLLSRSDFCTFSFYACLGTSVKLSALMAFPARFRRFFIVFDSDAYFRMLEWGFRLRSMLTQAEVYMIRDKTADKVYQFQNWEVTQL